MNRSFRLAVVGAVLMLLASPVAAGPLDDAAAAFAGGDIATGIRLYRDLAEAGDAKAQLALGLIYDLGRGVPRDQAQAVGWYRRAAEQGDGDAQFNLGVMFYNGWGTPQDYA
ncbi:MAG: tetratricopeptide repeat protein, partial [Phenylobacterium sp.]